MKIALTILLSMFLMSCSTISKTPVTHPTEDGMIPAPDGAIIFCEEHSTSELCETTDD